MLFTCATRLTCSVFFFFRFEATPGALFKFLHDFGKQLKPSRSLRGSDIIIMHDTLPSQRVNWADIRFRVNEGLENLSSAARHRLGFLGYTPIA